MSRAYTGRCWAAIDRRWRKAIERTPNDARVEEGRLHSRVFSSADGSGHRASHPRTPRWITEQAVAARRDRRILFPTADETSGQEKKTGWARANAVVGRSSMSSEKESCAGLRVNNWRASRVADLPPARDALSRWAYNWKWFIFIDVI